MINATSSASVQPAVTQGSRVERAQGGLFGGRLVEHNSDAERSWTCCAIAFIERDQPLLAAWFGGSSRSIEGGIVQYIPEQYRGSCPDAVVTQW